MVVIQLKAKFVGISVAILLLGSLGFNIYNHQKSANIESRYETMSCLVNQLGKSSMISFLVSEQADIEIFDISRGEVIKRSKFNSNIQNEVEKYLNAITGMYTKVKAFPEKGYIIKIPLNAGVKTKNYWLNNYGIDSVNEVFIIFPEQGAQYLLILDAKKRPLFFNFEDTTDELLKTIDFNVNDANTKNIQSETGH
ncbi:MAG: hypothetical protein Q8942_15345 [Bacillota bacterium]|nr:hypothetical protein [Bacillota bacterium]